MRRILFVDDEPAVLGSTTSWSMFIPMAGFNPKPK